MSAPYNSGRISADTQPSTTSSTTLFSRTAKPSQRDGEDSFPRKPAAGMRPNESNTTGADGAHSTLGQDLATRRQRTRWSGGFLLESSFSSGPRYQHGLHVEGGIHKGKRGLQNHGEDERVETKKIRAKRQLSPNSLALSQEVQDEQRNLSTVNYRDYGGAHGSSIDRIHVGKTRQSMSQPLSSERASSSNAAPQRQTIDPNQLVHMALNLSESRKRNVGAGQILPSQPRHSSGVQREDSFSNHGPGSSLRQYLNEQRRVSRNISPMGGKSSPSHNVSSSMQRSGSIAFTGSQTINISPATRARVEKARTYIELSIEYLRLLQHLPPLKPDASAPGNFVITSNNVPGSPQAQLTRLPSYAGKQHDLGRAYNPLQYIRNRRTRARERRGLDHPPEDFLDVEQVQEWIDRVEQQSERPDYRKVDAVQLPKYHADHATTLHPSKAPKPHKTWTFAPEELLADAFWLEQADNKMLVENRHGRRIFSPRETERGDFLAPRMSKESLDKRRRSWVDNIIVDPGTDNESDKGSERGRRLRLLPVLRTDSPRAGKHARRGSRLRNKEDSDSSDSDEGSRRRPRFGADPEQNIGPLTLLLEQQAKATQTRSPPVREPDTPDKWGRKENDLVEQVVLRDSFDVSRSENGNDYAKNHGDVKYPQKSQKNLAFVVDEIDPRSSIEDWDSTAPNTPFQPKRFPHIGSDLSPPPSRAGSETKKVKRSKLNPFYVQDHNSEYKHDLRPGSSGTDRNRGSRQPSEETKDEKHIGASILAAPGAVKNLLTHRKNDSVNSLQSPDKLQRRETQEPHSAVTRFLKGVKHEGSKVGEFIFRRDRADDSDADTVSDRHSLDFDTDASLKSKRAKRPAISRTATADTARSVSGNKAGRGHLELPSFRPVHETSFGDGNASDSEHHITRQARERKNSRSPRFDRLAPPRMDLGTLSGYSSDRSLKPSRSHSQDRIQQALARPGAGNLPGLFPTALRQANLPDRQRSSSRPTLDGKRHWSITDDDQHQLQHKKKADDVTQADIARVQALFLCSGVKAKELERRSHTPRSSPPGFLVRAADTAKVKLYAVPCKEEHVLAARILVKELEASTKSLQTSLETFRDKAIKELASKISVLHSTVESDLMPRILQSSEEAVQITSEVSGQGSLKVKEVSDDIDRMLRARRRRMRYLRGFGWMLVEWALVAVMWWLWLIVVLVGLVKRVFGLGWGILRWLLWL